MPVPRPQEPPTLSYPPDQRLREMVGVEAKFEDIFTPENIAACQDVINKARESFFDIVKKDLKTLDVISKKPLQLGESSESLLNDIMTLSSNIKTLAQLFDFAFITALTQHILANCEASQLTTRMRCRLIADLVDMLHIAVKQGIKDESQQYAKELSLLLGKV